MIVNVVNVEGITSTPVEAAADSQDSSESVNMLPYHTRFKSPSESKLDNREIMPYLSPIPSLLSSEGEEENHQ